VREAVLLRCAIAAGAVTDEMTAVAERLAETAVRLAEWASRYVLQFQPMPVSNAVAVSRQRKAEPR
jgi:hypothetical protein